MTSFQGWGGLLSGPGRFCAALILRPEFWVLGLWSAAAVVTLGLHEPWRDEVRALSIVSSSDGLWSLVNHLKNEGHPILWYLLLYVAEAVIDSPLSLKILAFSIGLLGSYLILFHAPFPIIIKSLAVFSVIGFYSVHVIARNYGIAVTLFIIFVVQFCGVRRCGWGATLCLCLLANTNAYAAVLTPVLFLLAVWDSIRDSARHRRPPPVKVISMGLALLAAVVFAVIISVPDERSIVTIYGRDNFDVVQWIYAFGHQLSRGFPNLWIFDPPRLDWGGFRVLIILALVLSLLPSATLVIAGLLGIVMTELVAIAVYSANLRHQVMLVVFLFCLHWIRACGRGETEDTTRARTPAAALVVWFIFLGMWAARELRAAAWDMAFAHSSSLAAAEHISRVATTERIVIVPEPDYLAESILYYLPDARLYLPREGRFRNHVSFTTENATTLTLSQLRRSALSVQASQSGAAVFVLLGHPAVEPGSSGDIVFSFRKKFHWTEAGAAAFFASFHEIADLNTALVENYRLFAVNPENNRAADPD